MKTLKKITALIICALTVLSMFTATAWAYLPGAEESVQTEETENETPAGEEAEGKTPSEPELEKDETSTGSEHFGGVFGPEILTALFKPLLEFMKNHPEKIPIIIVLMLFEPVITISSNVKNFFEKIWG